MDRKTAIVTRMDNECSERESRMTPDRRTFLRTGAAAVTLALAGCLGDVQGIVAGDVWSSGSVGSPHDIHTPYLTDSLQSGDPDRYRAWLFTAPPPEGVFTAAGAYLRRATATADYTRQFSLIVEARMALADRFVLKQSSSSDPRWTGLGELTVPLAVSDMREVDPAWYDHAPELVSTSRITYTYGAGDSSPPWRPHRRPQSVVAVIYNDEAATDLRARVRTRLIGETASTVSEVPTA